MHSRLLNTFVLWLFALAFVPMTMAGSTSSADVQSIYLGALVAIEPVDNPAHVQPPVLPPQIRAWSPSAAFAELTLSSRTAYDLNAYATRQRAANQDGPHVDFCALGFKQTDANGVNDRQTLLWCIVAHGRVSMFVERTEAPSHSSPLPVQGDLKPAGLAVGVDAPANVDPLAAKPASKFAARMRSILAVALAGSVLLSPPHDAYATSDDLAGGGFMGPGQEILPNNPRPPADPRLGPIPGWDLSAGPATATATFIAETQQVVLTWADVAAFPYTGFKIAREVLTNGEWLERTVVDAPAGLLAYADQPAVTGMYRYRVMAFNEQTNTRWSPPTQAFAEIMVIEPPPPPGPVVDPFWTVFTPSADTRIVYVSSSGGNDSNDGLSEGAPKRTIAAGYALLRNGYPDWMLLKRGDVWVNPPTIYWGKSGRSATERMLIAAYGTGERPMLRTGRSTMFTTPTIVISHVAFTGMHMIADTWDGVLVAPATAPQGIFFLSRGDDFLIEDCYFERYENQVVFQGWPSYTNLAIRRSVFFNPIKHAVGSSGNTNVFVDSTTGILLEENLFAQTLVHEAATQNALSHNIYIAENNGVGSVTAHRNIFYNGRSNLTCRPGGQVLNNLVIRGGLGLTVGHDASPSTVPATGRVAGNVITESRDHWNGQALGWGMDLRNSGALEVDHNLIFGSTSGTGNFGIVISNTVRAVMFRNNLLSDWTDRGSTNNISALIALGAPIGPIVFQNNTFLQPLENWLVNVSNSGSLLTTTFSGNLWQAATPTPFIRLGVASMSPLQWTSTYEPTATFGADPLRSPTVGEYFASIGGGATTDDFIIAAAQQSRTSWRPELTAAVVNRHLRDAFGFTIPADAE